MEQIQDLCHLLYPKKCCNRILLDRTFESDCIKIFFVKTLGYGIIFASTLVKLPQLLKLYSAKSGVGVSLTSVCLELSALTLGSAYAFANGFPFSAWGEALFLMLMTSFVAFLIIHYDTSQLQAMIFIISYGSMVALLMSGAVPMKILWFGQASSLPLIISSKLVQAWSNFKNGHTGNLSAITVILIFMGSLTRIFTSIQETGDQLIISGFMMSSVINLLLTSQIFIYWDKTNEFIRKNKSKKEN